MCGNVLLLFYVFFSAVCFGFSWILRKKFISPKSIVTHLTLHQYPSSASLCALLILVCIFSCAEQCVQRLQFAIISDSTSLIPKEGRVVSRRELLPLHTSQADYLSTGLNCGKGSLQLHARACYTRMNTSALDWDNCDPPFVLPYNNYLRSLDINTHISQLDSLEMIGQEAYSHNSQYCVLEMTFTRWHVSRFKMELIHLTLAKYPNSLNCLFNT